MLVMPEDAEEAVKVWRKCLSLGVPCLVLGNCSNLLVRDGGIRGCVLKLSPGLSGIALTGEATLTVRAGTLLSRLVHYCLELELSGLEFAVGIPGSVGGAIVMNAGAYGGDVGTRTVSVRAALPDGEFISISRDEACFEYRHSAFQHRPDILVLEATFALEPGSRDAIIKEMRKHASEREAKQPLDFPSAGSVFRRPSGYYVGPLIEKLGLKGLTVGGAQVSPKHAGFIVNMGNARAGDVLTLMEIIRKKVKDEFGIELMPEIVVVGEDA